MSIDRQEVETDQNEKVTMTFWEYDRMMKDFEDIHLQLTCPDANALDLFKTDLQKYLPYACYLDEYSEKAQSGEEKYRQRNLHLFIQNHLELIDNHVGVLFYAFQRTESEVQECMFQFHQLLKDVIDEGFNRIYLVITEEWKCSIQSLMKELDRTKIQMVLWDGTNLNEYGVLEKMCGKIKEPFVILPMDKKCKKESLAEIYDYLNNDYEFMMYKSFSTEPGSANGNLIATGPEVLEVTTEYWHKCTETNIHPMSLQLLLQEKIGNK